MEPSSSPDMRYKYPYLVGHRWDRRAPRKVCVRHAQLPEQYPPSCPVAVSLSSSNSAGVSGYVAYWEFFSHSGSFRKSLCSKPELDYISIEKAINDHIETGTEGKFALQFYSFG
ncbi:hypothetical protein V6N11_019085 [Hibiscus sabdariffa]|uniref:Uncharacterized protein n=1 Tax=Hibiscus sabdariffa TaxID=183260 RepID=A0ABR2R1E5_9ROSI